MHHLQILDVLSDRFFEANKAILTKVLLQDLLGTSSRQNLAQILAIIFEVFGNLCIRASLAHGGKERVPVVRFGEGKDAFVCDVGVNQSGNVQECGVADIDKPFCTSQYTQRWVDERDGIRGGICSS